MRRRSARLQAVQRSAVDAPATASAPRVRTPAGKRPRARASRGKASDTEGPNASQGGPEGSPAETTEQDLTRDELTAGNVQARLADEQADGGSRGNTDDPEKQCAEALAPEQPVGSDRAPCGLPADPTSPARPAVITCPPESMAASTTGSGSRGTAPGVQAEATALEIPSVVFKECFKAVTEFLEGMGASAAPDQLHNAVVNRLKRQCEAGVQMQAQAWQRSMPDSSGSNEPAVNSESR